MSTVKPTSKKAFLLALLFGVLYILSSWHAESAETGKWPGRSSLQAEAARPSLDGLTKPGRSGANGLPALNTRAFWGDEIREGKKGQKYGAFFGLRITLKLRGGWNMFSGADLDQGSGGLFERAADDLASRGVVIVRTTERSNHSGIEAGGDLIYSITPRFGIGVGAGTVQTRRESLLIFAGQDVSDDFLRSTPLFSIRSLRLGAYYTFPLSSIVAIFVNGGPALYFAEYKYSQGITSSPQEFYEFGLYQKDFFQEAKARRVGFEGGLGFEFTANPFVVFFLEAAGRYGKLSGFVGKENSSYFQVGRFVPTTEEGNLDFVETGKSPVLDIIPEDPAGAGGVRKATFNISGVSFFAGLKLRF